MNDKGVLESAADIDSNDPLTTYIQLKKEISIDKNSWLSLRYTMTNKSNTNIIRAPWQINRCPQAGFVFFEMGPGGQTHFTECQWVKNLNLKSSPGKPVWIDVANCPDRYKTICDGTGWLAHVYGKQLFIMRFDDIPAGQAAQGEGEIEIYVCNPQEEGQLGYVELEAQGTPIQLKPGEKTSWTVQWKAIILENEIPKNIDEEQKSKLYQYYYDIATMKK
ncbi:MAG: DUF4380 domain-containing protein [Deltaproteobacteria bacterium]|nr:DUF4380 domain-containing protein [Deltaproteobacteria bacterium]